MTCQCGATLGPDENFCGSCGAHRQGDDTPFVSSSGSVSKAPGTAGEDPNLVVSNYSHQFPDGGKTWKEEDPKTASEPVAESRGTGEIAESAEFSSKTSRVDDVPDKRPKPKALAGGKGLNGRFVYVI